MATLGPWCGPSSFVHYQCFRHTRCLLLLVLPLLLAMTFDVALSPAQKVILHSIPTDFLQTVPRAAYGS
jgi:hypothetical protein